MHEMVMRIMEPDLCYIFARNARRKGHPELALQAHRRAVDLKAQEHGPTSDAELNALRAIYAYEEALSHSKGKRTRATGTWQMVNRHGVLPAIARRLRARDSGDMLGTLRELGMEDYSFQAVIEKYPDAFADIAA
ncbi:MAG: hypothetical protein AAGA91_08300 [Pseudomonadota bacterium]